MSNTRPYYQSLPPVRPRLEQLYQSMHGCPPGPDEDLRPQAAYLKFVLPSPDHLDRVARQLAEDTAS